MTGEAATGRLRLRAAPCGERTVLTDLYRTSPFHPGPVNHRDGQARIILQDVTPGLFPGDRLHVDVEIAAGASLVVQGQGATKVYPAQAGSGAESTISLTVADAATLWWLPGGLIPFRDARLSTRTHVALAGTARFAHLDVITPGRVAMGERFAYERLDARLRVDVDGRARLIERATLEPRARPPIVTGIQGSYSCSGTLVLVGYPCPTDLERFGKDVWLGAGGGPELVIVRGLAHAADPLRDALLTLLAEVAVYAAGTARLAVDGGGRL